MKKLFRMIAFFTLFLPPLLLPAGCFSKKTVLEGQNRTFSSEEAGIALSLGPDWRLSESDKALFVADFQPGGSPLARLTATEEKEFPRLQDYFLLEPTLTWPQRTQKVSIGSLSHFQSFSTRPFEFQGNAWGES
ncbi:MAG TPA: hypothetical protein VIK48_01345, partial [Candidatus Manganitrophaceae bacterium]